MAEEVPAAKALFDKASDILGYDLLDRAINGPKDVLDSTVGGPCTPGSGSVDLLSVCRDVVRLTR